MSLQIGQRESEGIILDLKGPLTLRGDLELRDRLPAMHQSGKVNIVLNLTDVGLIDRTGLGTLVLGLARLRKAGGRLALLNLNRSHRKRMSPLAVISPPASPKNKLGPIVTKSSTVSNFDQTVGGLLVRLCSDFVVP